MLWRWVLLITAAVSFGVSLFYGLFLLQASAEAAIKPFAYYDAKFIGSKIPCTSVLSAGFVVVWRQKRGDKEVHARLCREIDGWVWYPETNDLSKRVPL